MSNSRVIDVSIGPSPRRAYDVRIGPGIASEILSNTPSLVGDAPSRAMLVFDSGVPRADRDRIADAIASGGLEVFIELIEPSERVKSLATLGRLLNRIAEARLERADPVIAVGGGIVGDIAGYAAASYRRGVPIIQCPTTLLAMVDASVGGKTGVNLNIDTPTGPRLVKNMAGAFWQPSIVLADVALLDSLEHRVLRCGLAECVKHGALGGFADAELGAWTRGALPRLLSRDHAALTELVARNVAVKASIVASDERETAATGGRALLNLGHTFGHAIEPMGHLSPTGSAENAPLQHGEAVALGVVAAAYASASMGLVDETLAGRLRDDIAAAGLPTSVDGLPDAPTLLDAMRDDKKVRAGHLRLVLPDGPGSCRVVDAPDEAHVIAGWNVIRA
ncbi:MAG: 3-dehydroquinate synthase family protein [Planctomycetota bacterium]